ncbi:NAD(P)H-binding protein [Novosphingobium sp. FSY-8]|uniref:NAD(P)H-binding protein n=1 Tax=Novosphingobium ovatum TaxID=1908523 RepID=A0ABW9XD90_9SPHN|nr:NAD(P)H-binding protein [Novosphingobium ovatum]NBC36522.1 NAD(P)H-binding protein [Novosphingobium ovatum]
MTVYAIAGATGQLGRKALDDLLTRVDPTDVVALARDPAKLVDYAEQGVAVRLADYDAPATLTAALAGVDNLLLISGNAVGARVAQHGAVIDAAKAAGVSFIAYTSILHADESPIGLAQEHRDTEALIVASGIPHALLRNTWYMENYTGSLAPALQFGVISGAAGDGRIAAATRADLGAAAAAVLADGITGVHELAGDSAFTMGDFAAEVAAQSGKPVAYVNMTQADYQAQLEGVGLPGFIAAMVADSSFQTSTGALFDDSGALSALIGRPTATYQQAIAAALAV